MGNEGAVKAITRFMWSLGDYNEMARLSAPAAETVSEAAAIAPGMEILDVAAGNGNLSVVAARRGARVVALDLTRQMVVWGQDRTRAEGLAVAWVEGDAEALPFAGGRFDRAASVFGAMFAPRPDVVTRELFRVTKPGGLVVMANWTPEGFLGRVIAAMTEVAPSPFDVPSPFLWGDPAVVRRRFAARASSIELLRRSARVEFVSTAEAVAFLERFNGPHVALRRALPPERYEAMMDELVRTADRYNLAGDGRLVAESEYLLVLATRD